MFGRVGELTMSGLVKMGRRNSVDRRTRTKRGVDKGGIVEVACFNKMASKNFLREVSIKVIIGSVLRLEFNSKEVGHLTHKVNIGEGLELVLKGNFSVVTRAKIKKIVNVKFKVEFVLTI